MGEAKKGAFSLGSGSKLRLEFHSAKVTSDAGLLACRDPKPLVDLFLVRRAPDAHAGQRWQGAYNGAGRGGPGRGQMGNLR